MNDIDVDGNLERLMRRWHYTTEFTTAAWAEYQALRETLPPGDHRVAAAQARWRAAERERQNLTRAIERLEETQAA
jgi:hypothetical protein